LDRQQRRKLNRVLAPYPELAKAYALKCRFWRWYDYRSLGWAQRRLTEWCEAARTSGLPELGQAAGTLETWREPILNYFRERVTNGYTEGINTQIKCIKRRGYGGNRFAHLRKRILLETA
jgi:transposase